MAFIAICYMYIDLFALQDIADWLNINYLLLLVEADNMSSTPSLAGIQTQIIYS